MDGSDSEDGLRRAIQKNNIANESIIECDLDTALAYFGEEQRQPAALIWPHLVMIDCKGPGTTQLLINSIRQCSRGATPSIVALVTDQGRIRPTEARRAGADSVVLVPSNKKLREETIMDVMTYWLTLDALASGPAAASLN